MNVFSVNIFILVYFNIFEQALGCGPKRISCLTEKSYKFCFNAGKIVMEIGNIKFCPEKTVCNEYEGTLPCLLEITNTQSLETTTVVTGKESLSTTIMEEIFLEDSITSTTDSEDLVTQELKLPENVLENTSIDLESEDYESKLQHVDHFSSQHDLDEEQEINLSTTEIFLENTLIDNSEEYDVYDFGEPEIHSSATENSTDKTSIGTLDFISEKYESHTENSEHLSDPYYGNGIDFEVQEINFPTTENETEETPVNFLTDNYDDNYYYTDEENPNLNIPSTTGYIELPSITETSLEAVDNIVPSTYNLMKQGFGDHSKDPFVRVSLDSSPTEKITPATDSTLEAANSLISTSTLNWIKLATGDQSKNDPSVKDSFDVSTTENSTAAKDPTLEAANSPLPTSTFRSIKRTSTDQSKNNTSVEENFYGPTTEKATDTTVSDTKTEPSLLSLQTSTVSITDHPNFVEKLTDTEDMKNTPGIIESDKETIILVPTSKPNDVSYIKPSTYLEIIGLVPTTKTTTTVYPCQTKVTTESLVGNFKSADSPATTARFTTTTTATTTTTTTTETTTSRVVNLKGYPPICISAGRYPAHVCNQYYECVRIMWWYQLRIRTCRFGQAFNPITLTCQRDLTCRGPLF